MKDNRTINIDNNTFCLHSFESDKYGEKSLKYVLAVNGHLTGFKFPTLVSGREFVKRYYKSLLV